MRSLAQGLWSQSSRGRERTSCRDLGREPWGRPLFLTGGQSPTKGQQMVGEGGGRGKRSPGMWDWAFSQPGYIGDIETILDSATRKRYMKTGYHSFPSRLQLGLSERIKARNLPGSEEAVCRDVLFSHPPRSPWDPWMRGSGTPRHFPGAPRATTHPTGPFEL